MLLRQQSSKPLLRNKRIGCVMVNLSIQTLFIERKSYLFEIPTHRIYSHSLRQKFNVKRVKIICGIRPLVKPSFPLHFVY